MNAEESLLFDKLVNEKLRSGDFWFEFDGQNCDGPCQGWDGSSRRCECSNRRVSWTFNYDKTDVYAEAW